jgi:SIR2-like protein/DUF2971 family protein
LTSAEFGDAYLRSGWASRYIYDLVRAYTVVLVGYQADDPPMRYPLEALEADRERYPDLQKVYAFASCAPGQEELVQALWLAKGVEPILYTVNGDGHSALYASLHEWRSYADDPTAWRRQRLQPILAQTPAAALEFFIACFSRARDDLGQWRAYADNGRGVAIGLSPSVFTVHDKPPAGQLPDFVGPIRYQLGEVCRRHEACVEEGAAIVLSIAQNRPDLLSNPATGGPFMEELVRQMIASPLIWNCLTSKHPAYQHEQEVR